MQETAIEWCTHSVNPLKYRDGDGKVVWACIKASAGCLNCYAEATAKRWKRGQSFTPKEMARLTPFIDGSELRQMRKVPPGSKVFIEDMSDLFGPWVPQRLQREVFEVIDERPDVVWMVLTKHPHNLANLLTGEHVRGNLWAGASVENQKVARQRIPWLFRVPAAVRYLSMEPLLEHVDLLEECPRCGGNGCDICGMAGRLGDGLDWIIVGGESGTGRRIREFDVWWARSLIYQAGPLGATVFVKQLGSKPREHYANASKPWPVDLSFVKDSKLPLGEGLEPDWWKPDLKDRKGGDILEWPEDLRVREFPR